MNLNGKGYEDPREPADGAEGMGPQIAALLLGELGEDEAAGVRRALAADPALREEFEELRGAIALLEDAAAEGNAGGGIGSVATAAPVLREERVAAILAAAASPPEATGDSAGAAGDRAAASCDPMEDTEPGLDVAELASASASADAPPVPNVVPIPRVSRFRRAMLSGYPYLGLAAAAAALALYVGATVQSRRNQEADARHWARTNAVGADRAFELGVFSAVDHTERALSNRMLADAERDEVESLVLRKVEAERALEAEKSRKAREKLEAVEEEIAERDDRMRQLVRLTEEEVQANLDEDLRVVTLAAAVSDAGPREYMTLRPVAAKERAEAANETKARAGEWRVAQTSNPAPPSGRGGAAPVTMREEQVQGPATTTRDGSPAPPETLASAGPYEIVIVQDLPEKEARDYMLHMMGLGFVPVFLDKVEEGRATVVYGHFVHRSDAEKARHNLERSNIASVAIVRVAPGKKRVLPSFTILLGSFRQESWADALKKKLEDAGHPGVAVKRQSDVYHTTIGRYPMPDAAWNAAASIEREGYSVVDVVEVHADGSLSIRRTPEEVEAEIAAERVRRDASAGAAAPASLAPDDVYRIVIQQDLPEKEARDYKLHMEGLGFVPVILGNFRDGGASVFYGNFATNSDAKEAQNDLTRSGIPSVAIVRVKRDDAASEGPFTIVVDSFLDRSRANELKKKLDGDGYLLVRTKQQRSVYYVTCGRYPTRETAVNVASAMKKEGYGKVEVVEVNSDGSLRVGAADSLFDLDYGAIAAKVSNELSDDQKREVAKLIEEQVMLSRSASGDSAMAERLREIETKLSGLDVKIAEVPQELAAEKARRAQEARKTVEVASMMRDAEVLARSGKLDDAIAKMDHILQIEPNNNMSIVRKRMWSEMKENPAQESAASNADRYNRYKAEAIRAQQAGDPASLGTAKALWAQIKGLDAAHEAEADQALRSLDQASQSSSESDGWNWRWPWSKDKEAQPEAAAAPAPRATPFEIAKADARFERQATAGLLVATPPPTPYPTPAATPRITPPPPRDMFFDDPGTNPFVDAARDPLSTFSADVDTASYTLVRNYLGRGALPPPEAVRVEEVVNYLPDRYPAPTDSTFAVYSEMAPSPFGPGHYLMKVGIKGREISEGDRKPVRLTFVIDVSGSMAQEGRLEMLKRALANLVSRMRPEDRIGIVTFETQAREVLPPTSVEDATAIHAALAALRPEGSTNAAAGLTLGYGMARRAFDAACVNRVVLCSDGVANVGATDAEAILAQAAQAANERIYMTAVGVGMGNHNDALLERLADKGQGHYAYVDDDAESARLMERLAGSMETIAQDLKIQVEFAPEAVARYRLVGYENRAVADADFRNDAVDAGEISGGHSVTALYEIEAAPGFERAERVAQVRLRFKVPDAGMEVKEIVGDLAPRAILKEFPATDGHFKLAAVAAEFGEILRNSWHARDGRLERVLALYDASFPADAPCAEAAELREMIATAAPLAFHRPAPRPPRADGGTRPADGDDSDSAARIPMR